MVPGQKKMLQVENAIFCQLYSFATHYYLLVLARVLYDVSEFLDHEAKTYTILRDRDGKKKTVSSNFL